jgi:hypothetical protein
MYLAAKTLATENAQDDLMNGDKSLGSSPGFLLHFIANRCDHSATSP